MRFILLGTVMTWAAAVGAQTIDATIDQSPTAPAAAQAPAPASGTDVSLRQKNLWGNQSYWNSDTYVAARLPYGFDLNAEFNDYKDESSTQATPTTTFGAGWTHGLTTLFASYGISSLANNSEGNATDVGVTMKSDDREFRTILTADVNVTHDDQYLRFPNRTVDQGITERTPTMSLTQRFFGALDANVTLSQSHYNVDILALTELLNRPRYQKLLGANDSSLAGLVDGFPDWTAKYQLKYYFDELPLTLKAYYETIHLVNTANGTNQTSDVEDYVAEYDVRRWLTVGLEYQHYRQTSQPTIDEYGASAAVRY